MTGYTLPKNVQSLETLNAVHLTVLQHIVSHVTGTFRTVAQLVAGIGMKATFLLITLFIGVPTWLLCTSLSAFITGHPIIAVSLTASLGYSFLVK